MVGIVLMSHGGMADGMMTSAPMLYPDISQVSALTLWPDDNPDEFKTKLADTIKQVDTGDGVFILVDLMGGTPSNQAMYSLGNKVRMLSGMNLPMLLSLLSAREDTADIEELAHSVLEETLLGTVDVNELLKQKGLLQ